MSVIYRLTDSEGRFYIGSTTDLNQRLFNHKDPNNSCRSKRLLDDWTCDILEETDKVGDDLLWLERKYFDVHYGNPQFVNKQRPIRTQEEKEELHRLNSRRYYKENDQYYKEYFKGQYQKNKEERIKYRREHYSENKARINEKKKETFKCECGSTCRKSDRARHFKSKKHLSFVNS